MKSRASGDAVVARRIIARTFASGRREVRLPFFNASHRRTTIDP